MNPRIRPHFSVIAHSPDLVELRYGVWNPVSFTLRDDSASGTLARLAYRLDGTASAERIAKEEQVSIGEVERLTEELEEVGALETGPRNVVDALLQRVPGSGGGIGGSPDVRPLDIISDADTGSQLRCLLRSEVSEIQVHDDGSELFALLGDSVLADRDDGLAYYKAHQAFDHLKGRFVLVARTTVDPIRLKHINRVCLEQRVPWLSAVIDGPFVFIGPLIVPRRAACFECFETRLLMNLRESASYQHYKHAIVHHKVRHGDVPAKQLLVSLLTTHAAIEATTFALTGHACTVGKVLSIYTPTMEFAYHDILRVPNCDACGAQMCATGEELYFDHSGIVAESTELM